MREVSTYLMRELSTYLMREVSTFILGRAAGHDPLRAEGLDLRAARLASGFRAHILYMYISVGRAPKGEALFARLVQNGNLRATCVEMNKGSPRAERLRWPGPPPGVKS